MAARELNAAAAVPPKLKLCRRVLALAYRDINLPAEAVGPPGAAVAASEAAAWQTLGGPLTGSDSDESSR